MGDIVLLHELCAFISSNPSESIRALRQLHALVKDGNVQLVQHFRPVIIGTMYKFIQKPDDFRNSVKTEVINVFMEMFKKTKTENVGFYFNISAFLVGEIYEPKERCFQVYEEYKLLVVNCLIALNTSIPIDKVIDIYSKEHIPKYSPIIYACIGVARSEKLRVLRIAAMECIMTIARIDGDFDLSDIVLYSQIADIFMFFLPGLSSGLNKICMEDEKIGHKVTKTAVKTWGRLISLLTKDYNPLGNKINFDDITSLVNKTNIKQTTRNDKKWKNDAEVEEYIKTSTRTREWYKKADEKLYGMFDTLQNLCNHCHWTVRSELADVCLLLLENCTHTIPKCSSKIVTILITLSEDNDEKVSEKCKLGLENLSNKLSSSDLTHLLHCLEDDFYRLLNSIPRTFNGIDNHKQRSSLNLLIGYIRLFGKYQLISVLHSTTGKLVESLLYICELERSNAQLLEEWIVQDFDQNPDLRTPWKKFEHFASEDLVLQLRELCRLLAQDVVVNVVTDCLLDVYANVVEKRKEATVLLNEIVSANQDKAQLDTVKTLLDMYLDPDRWNIPIAITESEEDRDVTLSQIQNNIVQLCLQLEGIGKMALLLGSKFQDLLLKTLYPVLEKAGSGQPLLKAAGLSTITNISVACGYRSVTELINNNSDYFSYHVTRKLKRLDKNEHVLNVLGVVMDHCSMNVLPSIGSIVEDVLFKSRDCNDNNIAAFMKVFSIFTKCVLRWLDVKIDVSSIRSKAEIEQEKQQERFEVSNLKEGEEANNFSDDVMMGKTAEEMYEEDMKRKQEGIDVEDDTPEMEEYKKPEPPQHIKLTVSILQRTLHFLPSKQKETKILSLEILKNGLELIRDWEDELLPIVHLIWSPLVNRFMNDKDPLIFNLSFQLLMVLARLSKDFIRSRTVKDVLPSILDNLLRLSKESHLKDKGSAYRYTQDYKLQAVLLENLARITVDLELSQEQMENCMKTVSVYLSDKQPLPLRMHCIEFFKALAIYDAGLVKTVLERITRSPETERNIQNLLDTLN